MKVVVGLITNLAGAEHRWFVAEIHLQPLVEDIERAFPESLVPECLSVAKDSSVNLVHLVEAAILHDQREDLAANATCAVGDDRLVLQVVVFAAFQFLDKIGSIANIRYHCVLEAADARLELVATVEEDDIVPAFIHEFMNLLGAEVCSATDDPIRTKNNFIGHTERDDFVAHPHRQAWEIISDTDRPFVVDVIEGRKLPGDPTIFLDQIDRPADRAIDAILGKDDATFQSEAFAQCKLP